MNPEPYDIVGTQFGIGNGSFSLIENITVTFANGSSFTPSVTAGSSNQAIGRFQLTAASSGALLTSASIKLNGIRTGMTNIKLLSSTNATFESGSDTQLGATVSSDPGDGNSVTFSSFSSSISTSGTYYFIACDVAAGATGEVQGVIVQNSSLTISSGSLAGVCLQKLLKPARHNPSSCLVSMMMSDPAMPGVIRAMEARASELYTCRTHNSHCLRSTYRTHRPIGMIGLDMFKEIITIRTSELI